ncbi:hypothetical protein CBM2634_B40020 [Cupriavidus taiwanensis]|uniref:Uncharacterized protein n=1 Tax=Cupriavidus taiwanensis TaxID=164546 RepID=A0A375J8Q1_9BURK|nr:hypothetical protein CBM2634_B40020 [Cupriavidus taiwanensis]
MKLRSPLHRKTQRILPRTVGGDEHIHAIVFRRNIVMTMAIHSTPPHTRNTRTAAF